MSKKWGRHRLSQGLYRPFPELVARQSIAVGAACVFRHDVVDLGAIPDAGPAWDLWLAFALCRTGRGAYYVRDCMATCRVHAGQVTGTRDELQRRGSLVCWRSIAEDPLFRPVRRTVRRKLADAACGLVAIQLAAGNHRAANASARLSIRARPINWKAWAVLGFTVLPRGTSRVVTGMLGYQS